MRNNNQHHINSQSTFGGVEQVMTLDQNSLAHLMAVLTDLYSDAELAVIREYATNALDSHLAAGNKQPIVVNLPNALNPAFEVTDHGTGLSVDDLINVYSKYGYSTKRDNDVEAGMLGLGCKSALTYTDQFTVTAVKDGVRALAVVARGADGTGSIKIVDTSSTVERNGVTISVPVKNASSFCAKAKEFFQWWTPGTVLVDGDEPKLPAKHVRVADDLVLAPGLDSDYVVMGNIAYPVERYQYNLSASLPYHIKVVAFVPMGSVNFTPSREALTYTNLSAVTLRRIEGEVKAKTKAAAQRDIAATTTHEECLDAILRWWGIAQGPFTFQGHPVPHQFTAPDGILDYNTRRYRHKAQRTGAVSIQSLRDENVVFVEGFGPKTLTTSHRKRLDLYCEQQDITATQFYITANPLGMPWSANVERIKWADVKAVKLPRTGGKSGGPEPIKVWDGKDWIELDDKDKGDDVIVWSPAQENLSASYIHSILPDVRTVCLGKNRWDKFLRERPNAKRIDVALKERIAEFDKSLTESDRIALGGLYSYNNLRHLDPDKLVDADLADAVRNVRAAQHSRAPERRRSLMTLAQRGEAYGIPNPPKPDTDPGKVIDKYPFLRYTESTDTEHAYEYVAALHTTRENN